MRDKFQGFKTRSKIKALTIKLSHADMHTKDAHLNQIINLLEASQLPLPIYEFGGTQLKPLPPN